MGMLVERGRLLELAVVSETDLLISSSIEESAELKIKQDSQKSQGNNGKQKKGFQGFLCFFFQVFPKIS